MQYFSSLWHAAFLLSSFVGSIDAQIIQLTSTELYEMSTGGDIDLLIDVRTETEWDQGHIENATFVKDLQVELRETSDYEATLKSLNLWDCRFCRVAVYCASGARAGQALEYLVAAGFEGPLFNGLGATQWTNAGYELVTDPSKEDRPCMNVDDSVAVARNEAGVCTAETEDLAVQESPLSPPEVTEEQPINEVIQLNSEEFYTMSTAGEFDLVIDVRTEYEWNTGHIENATFIKDLQVELAETDDYQATLTSLNLWGCRYCRVAVYCRSGNRAGVALDHLVKAGFEGPLYNGLGVNQWTSEGYELVNDPSKEDRPCMTVDNPELVSREQSGVCGMGAVQLLPEPGSVMPFPESENSEAYYDMVQTEMDANKDLFLAQMDAHNATTYSFLFTLSCFCPPADYPWLVTAEMQQLMMGVKPNLTQDMSPIMLVNPIETVMGGAVQSAVTSAGEDVILMEDTFLQTYSILDLFDKIQDAIDRQAHEIQVVFNATWGYPESIFIDYSQQMADEEFITSVSDFSIVENSLDEEADYGMDANTSQIEFDEGQ